MLVFISNKPSTPVDVSHQNIYSAYLGLYCDKKVLYLDQNWRLFNIAVIFNKTIQE